ncbi:MAG: hypothetical protein ABIH66_01905 [bacterium]
MEENKKLAAHDRVFIESIVEEINEMMYEKYRDDEVVPVTGVCRKEDIPGDFAIWVHMFKAEDVKKMADE